MIYDLTELTTTGTDGLAFRRACGTSTPQHDIGLQQLGLVIIHPLLAFSHDWYANYPTTFPAFSSLSSFALAQRRTHVNSITLHHFQSAESCN
jgi:hypothetical protein